MTCVTGVSGSRQDLADQRDSLQDAGGRAQRRPASSPGKHRDMRRRGIAGQGHRHRPVPHRADTPLQPGHLHRRVHRHPRRCSPRPATPRCAATSRAGSRFNVKGGRCEACEGDGIIQIEMHFLPDIYVPCEVCKGKRYNRETLEVKYKGKNIYDVLDMTVEEALRLLREHPARSTASSRRL